MCTSSGLLRNERFNTGFRVIFFFLTVMTLSQVSEVMLTGLHTSDTFERGAHLREIIKMDVWFYIIYESPASVQWEAYKNDIWDSR